MPASPLLFAFFHKVLLWLEQWDTSLFLKVNTVWTNPFFDSISTWWREPNTWLPLYLFLAVFALINFKQKALPWILFAVLTLILTDQISSTLIKSWVARPRPCNDPFLMSRVRLLLDSCGGAYSFTSSHAVNHFGFAMFVFISLRPIFKKWGYLFFFWAATIAYAQVYVGVHYPLDVLCGSILGCAIGYITGTFFNKIVSLTTITNDQ
jgi:undecaprenyl-diphosphatase